MPASIPDLVLTCAVVCHGALAGLFFAFSCAIGPALRRVDDLSYIEVFRAINAAILNAWFLLAFFAAPLSAAAASMVHLRLETSTPLMWLLPGVVCSVLTTGITVAANVPLNQALDRAEITTSPLRRAARARFEGPWNRWNLWRTLSSFGALVALAGAAVTG